MSVDVERYIGIAVRAAARVTPERPVKDSEAYSAAVFGLVLAASRYDPSRGPFEPFAATYCRGYALTAFNRRCMQRVRERPAKEDFVARPDGQTEALVEQLKADSPFDRAVIDLFAQGLTQSQVAARLGVTRQRIGQRVNRIRAKYMKERVCRR